MRVVPRALKCSPTLRPPSAAANCGPAVLPTSVVARKPRVALLHPSSAKSSTIKLVRSLPGLGLGASWFLTLPLRAVLQEVLAGLDLVLEPPAFGVWPFRRPLEVLACEVVTRLELEEPRGEPLDGSSHSWVQSLLLARSVLAVLGSDQLWHILATRGLLSISFLRNRA